MNPRSPAWEDTVAELVTAGAEIEVQDSDGAVVLRAPLARHQRVDEDGTLWIRPIVGGYVPQRREPGDPEYAFSLTEARARAVSPSGVRLARGEIGFLLRAGQHVVIRLATPAMRAELERWDTFVTLHLSAAEEAELDRLDGTNWYGRWP